MRALPPALKRIIIPAVFSPSQLGLADQCLLRAVLGSTRRLPTLTAHPAAALGSVFHKLLELAVRNQIPRAGAPAADAETALESLLDDADARLAQVWSGDPPRLKNVFPPLTWRRKRRVVLDLAEKYLSGAVPPSPTNSGRSDYARDLAASGSWSEVPFDVPMLRLRGRADLIQRSAGTVVIRDLKTGRVTTNEGEVLSHIERQMRLYGAMAREVWPSAEVKLVVDYGEEREIAFGLDEEHNLMRWLRDILDRLPPEKEVDTQSLANPGDGCSGCGHRHICPAYRAEAPQFWQKEMPMRMPLDTWGEVVAIVPNGDRRSNLTIRDAAGRTVKVFGLTVPGVDKLVEGNTVWFFGLRTRDRLGGPELWRHPRNFFEVADDDPFARAWTVEMFLDQHTIKEQLSDSIVTKSNPTPGPH